LLGTKSLYFFQTEHYAMKAYWGVEVELHAFLSSALDQSGQLHAPAVLFPGKEPLVPAG